MSVFFDINTDLIVVTAHLFGPSSDTIVRLALDTGAVGTLIHPDILTAVSYDLAQAPNQVRIVTASGVETVPRLVLQRIKALDQERNDLLITCHALPPTAGVEGLLGLDYIRGQRLIVDYRAGEIALT